MVTNATPVSSSSMQRVRLRRRAYAAVATSREGTWLNYGERYLQSASQLASLLDSRSDMPFARLFPFRVITQQGSGASFSEGRA
jgi:hypothetical protein